ncbi:MAG TPA: pantetheine-phosphate adenylyltransferase [Thermoplasmata archaeon]|nr:pantetheine-phosphate adenylyltransferase [Thermoplasmata archaeon]
MRRYHLAVLGGTFDHLHIGHHALVATAFRVGETVAIGLTTDRFIADHPKPDGSRIQPFAIRRAALTRWVRRSFPGRRFRVVPLEDRFGRSIEPDVGALVVSRETLSGGRAVNRERRRLGRRPVPLIVVPLALADDLEPVSSRRVRAGSIGTAGQRFTGLRVNIAVGDPRDLGPSSRAVRRVFPQARIVETIGPMRAPLPPADLTLRVDRTRQSGWTASERSALSRLSPRRIRGHRPEELERGLASVLRPRDERKLFGTPRS